MKLTFAALRLANLARLPLFTNALGNPAHTEPDGSDWSLNDWMVAVTGEVGEAANVLKKVLRGDISLAEARPMLAKEYADIVTYLDILAFQTGIDLGDATAKKWDEVSARVGAPLRIETYDDSSLLAWLGEQGDESGWQARQSTTGRGYRLHQPGPYRTPEGALLAARDGD